MLNYSCTSYFGQILTVFSTLFPEVSDLKIIFDEAPNKKKKYIIDFSTLQEQKLFLNLITLNITFYDEDFLIDLSNILNFIQNQQIQLQGFEFQYITKNHSTSIVKLLQKLLNTQTNLKKLSFIDQSNSIFAETILAVDSATLQSIVELDISYRTQTSETQNKKNNSIVSINEGTNYQALVRLYEYAIGLKNVIIQNFIIQNEKTLDQLAKLLHHKNKLEKLHFIDAQIPLQNLKLQEVQNWQFDQIFKGTHKELKISIASQFEYQLYKNLFFQQSGIFKNLERLQINVSKINNLENFEELFEILFKYLIKNIQNSLKELEINLLDFSLTDYLIIPLKSYLKNQQQRDEPLIPFNLILTGITLKDIAKNCSLEEFKQILWNYMLNTKFNISLIISEDDTIYELKSNIELLRLRLLYSFYTINNKVQSLHKQQIIQRDLKNYILEKIDSNSPILIDQKILTYLQTVQKYCEKQNKDDNEWEDD